MNQDNRSPNDDARSPLAGGARLVWLTVGWVCVAIGVVGLILPLLPGFPFLIIALWAFSKSSERFHHWLYTHEVYGPPLRSWNRYRVIPPKAKLTATVAMALALVILVVTGADLTIVLVVAGILAVCAAYVLSRPNYAPHGATQRAIGER